MIFVTIGTQEPFDRLIKAVDEVAPLLGGHEVVAQTFRTDYEVLNMKTLGFLPPEEFNEYFKKADLIISHAGMGSIISALVDEKPIIVMPRMLKHGEHRNDHQFYTAKRFEEMQYVHVAYDELELKEMLLQIANNNNLKVLHKLGVYASSDIVNSIKDFIQE